MLFKKIQALALTTVMVFSGLGLVQTMAKDKAKIFIAGDSTACIYGRDDNYSVAREGWGMAFSYMVNEDKAEVVDLALSGRSSKSYIIEDNYKTLLNDMGEGDYLIIQFGHNDQKADKPEEANDPTRIRYTSDKGDKDTEGSFKHSLYVNFVLPAEERGATPILCTPVSRHDFEDGKCTDSHGNYDDCIRELAKELNIPCVDMTTLTSDLYNLEGETQTQAYHAIYKDVEKGKYGHDDTHFNKYGALTVAELARGELLKIDGIKDLLRPAKTYTQTYTKYYTVKRADYAATMARILGAEPVEDADEVFIDTNKETNPNEIAYLQAAKDLGIIKGDDKGNFNPDTELKFEDMAIMTARTLAIAGFEPYDYDYNIKNVRDFAKADANTVMYYFENVIVNDVKGDEAIDMVSAESMYVNLYDLIHEEADVEKVQTLEEIEKVE
ncbi:MAG: GDSL-type esterase/lipase family protein [Lachnospirales bacterium]